MCKTLSTQGELLTVLNSKRKETLALVVNATDSMLIVVAGDGKPYIFLKSEFPLSGDGTEADFNDVEIIDCGQTIRLGKYEVAVDALIW
jgi:hypothetical protein